MNKTTPMAQAKDIQRSWYIVDASDKILGRVAARVASIIKGKHKPIFTPHVDCGDYVVVVNVSKIKVTGRKLKEKIYATFSGYPGGRKETTLEVMLKTKPVEVMEYAVRLMLPRRPLYRQALKKLKVYADERHPFNKKVLKPLEV